MTPNRPLPFQGTRHHPLEIWRVYAFSQREERLFCPNHRISFQMSVNSNTPGILKVWREFQLYRASWALIGMREAGRKRRSVPFPPRCLQKPTCPSKAAMSHSPGQSAQPWSEGCDDLKHSFSCHQHRAPGFLLATVLLVPAEMLALQPQGPEWGLQCPHKIKAGPGTLSLGRETQGAPYGRTSQLVWPAW